MLVKSDYSQVELRIAAELFGRPTDARGVCRRRGSLIHALTATSVLGRSHGEVRPKTGKLPKHSTSACCTAWAPSGYASTRPTITVWRSRRPRRWRSAISSSRPTRTASLAAPAHRRAGDDDADTLRPTFGSGLFGSPRS